MNPPTMITSILPSERNHSLHWLIFSQWAGKRDVIFYYEGYFSQTIIAAVADAVKMRIEHNGVAGATRRKLFSTFIEMTQNIIHYSVDAYTRDDSATFNNEIRHGSVYISAEGAHYHLHCANPVHADVASELRRKLEHLRGLSGDDIRREYRKSLRNETVSDSKGAGLGLLTIARDASEPLEFDFVPIPGSENALFYMKATI